MTTQIHVSTTTLLWLVQILITSMAVNAPSRTDGQNVAHAHVFVSHCSHKRQGKQKIAHERTFLQAVAWHVPG
jgi:hypothetical protein